MTSGNQESKGNSSAIGKSRRLYKTILSWTIALVGVGLIALKVFAGSSIGPEVILIIALLIALLVYDEVKELRIGSILTLKREVGDLRERHRELSREITQLRLGVAASQAVSFTIQQALPGLDFKEIVSKQTELELVRKEKEELEERVDLLAEYINELKNRYTDQGQLIKHLSQKVIFYAIEYYNYFLVANTKNVLAWLGQRATVARREINDEMNRMGIPRANQEITLEVLLEARMVEYHQETTTYSITSFGRFFLDVKNIKYTDPALLQWLRAYLAEEGHRE